MRIGIVGLDNSHCVLFSRMLNDPEDPLYLPGAKVTLAYRGGSEAFSMSKNRIDGFTAEVTGRYGVRLCETIESLVENVDAVLLESCDGRQHLDQFRKLAVGKPVYVDKPFATSAQDALAMIRLARATNTPLMSCSALRFAPGLADLAPGQERVLSCEAFGHTPILNDFPGFFWYGVHSAEVLFRFMGRGCRRVRYLPTMQPDIDLVVGEWSDGRGGILRGTRFGRSEYGSVVHTDAASRCLIIPESPRLFQALLQHVTGFFQTHDSPVNPEETYEIVAFLEATNLSQEKRGVVVEICSAFDCSEDTNGGVTP